MDIMRDLLFSQGSSKPAAEKAAAPLEKPTVLQSLFGTGEHMKELGRLRREVTKGYMTDLGKYRKERHDREKDFKKSVKEQRESYFGRKVGRWDLVHNDPSKEELRDPGMKEIMNKYEKIEENMRESFHDSERAGEQNLKKNFHKELKQTSHDVRQGGLPTQQADTGHLNFMQHLTRSSSQPTRGSSRRAA